VTKTEFYYILLIMLVLLIFSEELNERFFYSQVYVVEKCKLQQ